MSTATKRLRRAGVGGVAAAVAFGSLSVMSPAFAAVPNVTAGASNQAAADVSGTFKNDFTAGAALTFTIHGNDCSSTAGLADAVGFASMPTLAVSPAAGSDASTGTPSFGPGVLASDGAQCGANGIQDQVTFKTTSASVGSKLTDDIDYVLSNIKYNVGAGLAAGTSIDIDVTGLATDPGVATANVVTTSYTVIPVVSALPNTTVGLGTVTFKETTAEAYFPAGKETTVVLTLTGGGKFTKDVTPTVTAPTGYIVSSKPATTAPAAATYTFKVTAPATAVKATVSVSGLKFDAAGAGQNTLKASVTPAGGAAVNTDDLPAVNVVDYAERTGGADRYATSAALFKKYVTDHGAVTEAVLSGGELFPDALSANYLAGKLGTSTLLTKANQLPATTRQALLDSSVKTVYITGGTAAVSDAVANEIRSLHVGGDLTKGFINVVRLGGADRYATNQAVNEYNFTSSNTVLLAAGTGFADALALGPIAYSSKYPLILTKGGTLGATEQTQLNDFNPTNVVIAGGTGVVSQALEDSLRAKGYNVFRLGGADRTLTAAAVATWASEGIAGAPAGSLQANGPLVTLDDTTTFITNGLGFADALSAGPVAGKNHSVIMPTAGVTKLGAGLASYLGSKTVADVDTLWALGLTGAVSNSVMKDAAAAIGS